MPKESATAAVERAIARVAAGRYGVLHFTQLVDAGVNPSGITDRLRAGCLHHTVDFLWPSHRLIVEADDFRSHGPRSGFESDRARDAWLAARGYRVVRFTWRQLTEEPETVVAVLRALLGPS